MSEIILYPTETVYALGVNPFDRRAWDTLCALKGRGHNQTASWLVRSIDDVKDYAEVTPEAYTMMRLHLPGPLTVILKAKSIVPKKAQALDGTVSFRISSDPFAQKLIEEYMAVYDAPLTCTSANLHGMPTMSSVADILEQFSDKASLITKIVDGGVRNAQPSTIVRIVDNKVSILRQGSVVINR